VNVVDDDHLGRLAEMDAILEAYLLLQAFDVLVFGEGRTRVTSVLGAIGDVPRCRKLLMCQAYSST
jgi:hypothetical protein